MDRKYLKKIRVILVFLVIFITIFLIYFIFLHASEKKDVSMKLRMFFGDMSQAMQFSTNGNGSPGEWNWQPGYKNSVIINRIAKNLRVDQSCVKTLGSCFVNSYYKNLNGASTLVNLYNLPSIHLFNGVSVAFETIGTCKNQGEQCALIYVDINGVDAPNAFGKDLFVFTIINSPSTTFIPYNMSVRPDSFTSDEKLGCNKYSAIPMYCSAFLYTKNWIIDSSYPW